MPPDDEDYDPYRDPESPLYDPYADPDSPLYDPYLDPDAPWEDEGFEEPEDGRMEEGGELHKEDCETFEEDGFCMECCIMVDRFGRRVGVECEEVECESSPIC